MGKSSQNANLLMSCTLSMALWDHIVYIFSPVPIPRGWNRIIPWLGIYSTFILFVCLLIFLFFFKFIYIFMATAILKEETPSLMLAKRWVSVLLYMDDVAIFSVLMLAWSISFGPLHHVIKRATLTSTLEKKTILWYFQKVLYFSIHTKLITTQSNNFDHLRI